MSERSEELRRVVDGIGRGFFGRTVAEAHEAGVCIACGQLAVVFSDDRSKQEYDLSALCQACQDKTFGVGA
jgi:hypothetical protein